MKLGGGERCFKNMFLFPICILQKVTILAQKQRSTFMEIGIQMQNHKIETTASLYMKMGAFDRL